MLQVIKILNECGLRAGVFSATGLVGVLGLIVVVFAIYARFR
jgi:hypothetical protein